jgi:imidazolonepropionase-like amidohydrolase
MVTIIKNAELLDYTHEFEQLNVITDGEIIRSVGQNLDEATDMVIDLEGYTLLPAIIDAHVHVACPDGLAGQALSAWPLNGISTVCDLGMLNESSLEDYISWLNERDDADHASVITAGKYIDIPNGYGMGPSPEHIVGIPVNTPQEAANAVRREYEAGIGCVKIGLSDIEGPFGPRPSMPPEMLKAIADCAHSLGLWVYVHSFAAETIDMLIECGVDVAAHTPHDLMNEKTLVAAAKAGLILVSTIGDPDELPPPDIAKEIVEKMSAGRDVAREAMMKNLKAYHDIGGIVAMGTDNGVHPIAFTDYSKSARIPIYELRNLIAAGFSMRDTLECATISAAKAMHTDDIEGSIDVGKRANLIAVKNRPDETFSSLHDVRFVMNRGKILITE